MTRVHAFADDALGHHDAVGLVAEIRAGRVSIPEVVDAALARTAAVNDRLNAVAYDDAAGARRRAADPHGGYFAGVPTYIKDNVDVAGMPTQRGADAWRPRPRPADGDFARMYLATGLLPLGKSQLSEFGFSASAEHPRLGPVRCPWDPDRTSGTSGPAIRAIWESLYGVDGMDVDPRRSAIPGTTPPAGLPVFGKDGSILPPARKDS
jgi:amidase